MSESEKPVPPRALVVPPPPALDPPPVRAAAAAGMPPVAIPDRPAPPGQAAPPGRRPPGRPAAPPRKPPAGPDPGWSAGRPMVIGMLAVAALVLGFGVWGATASISGAVVAMGQIEVEARRQVIQHPDGGVVGEIFVRDGDLVDAGQTLIRLDDTLLRSELNIVEGQLFEIVARRGRLAAERDGKDEIAFAPELLELAATRKDIADLAEGQRSLFLARRETRGRETSQLRERQAQMREQIRGIEAQQAALEFQLLKIQEELKAQRELLAKGLAQAPRVLALERDEAGLQGRVGEFIAAIAQAKGRIAEIEIEILKVDTKMREDAIALLRDLEYREVELRERRLTALEKLSRLDIRSPVRGIVYGNTVFAVRAVVRPAEPVMYIVPVDSALVITTRVEPIHIDEVHVGQDAVLRFAAFSSRTTPELTGTVVQVSADAFVDEARGFHYYTARVEPKPGELEKLGDLALLPGMPVEAYIQTGERSALDYFTRPLTDYFRKAMREE